MGLFASTVMMETGGKYCISLSKFSKVSMPDNRATSIPTVRSIPYRSLAVVEFGHFLLSGGFFDCCPARETTALR
jgi:hypothetical protein